MEIIEIIKNYFGIPDLSKYGIRIFQVKESSRPTWRHGDVVSTSTPLPPDENDLSCEDGTLSLNLPTNGEEPNGEGSTSDTVYSPSDHYHHPSLTINL